MCLQCATFLSTPYVTTMSAEIGVRDSGAAFIKVSAMKKQFPVSTGPGPPHRDKVTEAQEGHSFLSWVSLLDRPFVSFPGHISAVVSAEGFKGW